MAAQFDWSVHPGEILAEELQERGMSQAEFCRLSGWTPKHVNRVIKGHVAISAWLADSIESTIGVPAHVLMRMQADWDLWSFRNGAEGGKQRRRL